MPTKIKKTVKSKTKAAKPIGKITHYYDKIGVGIIKLNAVLKIGDILRFVGKKGEFTQTVTSLQFQHKPIDKAAKGKEIGMKVDQKVNEGDLVYKAAK
ncbi:hypothetical protein HZC21_06670 [Candidatus Peregrinibacteria bacterium]|nr:hypothetical protein [Candidatus Peregrinibacteria bacterium]